MNGLDHLAAGCEAASYADLIVSIDFKGEIVRFAASQLGNAFDYGFLDFCGRAALPLQRGPDHLRQFSTGSNLFR